MLKEISVKQMTEIVKRVYNSNLGKSLVFLGRGGIGKSEAMKSLSEELGIGYLDLRLLQYNLTDFKGIPFKSDIDGYTRFLMSDILPRKATVNEDATDPRFQDSGILVLDEITSAPKSLRTLMYQLVNERCLGEYVLPQGWVIVLLGNGSEDGGDFNGIEGNLLNRCFSYRVEVSLEDFKSYIENNFTFEVANVITGYLSYKVDNLHTFNPDKLDENDLVFASPRSWTKVAGVLQGDTSFLSTRELDEVSKLLIYGAIGCEVGMDFISYIGLYAKLPNLDSIVDGKYDFLSGNPTVKLGVDNVEDVLKSLKAKEDKVSQEIYTELSTSKERALGTVLVSGLFDKLIACYKEIPQESMDRVDNMGADGIDEHIDNFVEKARFIVNFISDYLSAENFRMFTDLIGSNKVMANKLGNLELSMFLSIFLCTPKMQDTKYIRAIFTEQSAEYLALGDNVAIALE